MPSVKRLSTSGRRGAIVTAAAGMLAIGGLALIVLAATSQRSAAQPPLTLGDPGAIRTSAELQPHRSPSASMSQRPVGLVLSRSKPVWLDIPAIDVHSTVQHLGRDAEGGLEVPAPGPHYDEAAWYRNSPTPGSLGPAIVMGHVDSAANGPSVFFRLGELGPGDRVSITRADGSVAAFVVDEIHRYSKEDFPTQRVYGDIQYAGLRILTCGGAFDSNTGHYVDNIVVFASLDSSERP